MFLDRLPDSVPLSKDPKMRNDFFIGNLLPDAGNDKTVTHFYDPAYLDRMIVWPRPEKFLEKYKDRMNDPICLGYYYHLYIDKRFLKEYLPGVVQYYDASGNETEVKEEVRYVEIRKSGQRIEKERYLSEEFYYGDYTKMNTWLCERYHLPVSLKAERDPGISEIDFAGIYNVLRQLAEYRRGLADAVKDLKVFDVETLTEFLEKAAEDFCVVLN